MGEFKECAPDNIKTYLERKVTTVYEMATLDKYALRHKHSKLKYESGSGSGPRPGSSSDLNSKSDQSYGPNWPFNSYKSTNKNSRGTHSQRDNS